MALSITQPSVGSGSLAPPCQALPVKCGSGWNCTLLVASSTVPQPNCQASWLAIAAIAGGLAAIDELERVGQFVDGGFAAEREAEQVD